MNLGSDPAEITIQSEYTKTGEQRSVFISREAREVLKEWLKVRDWLRKELRRKSR